MMQRRGASAPSPSALAAGALLLVTMLAAVSCGLPEELRGRPNIILVSIDTLRADHLGCYGYGRDTSPTMDSLAAAGTMWTRCIAQSPWTLPSHATIWTGLSEAAHRSSWYEGEMHVLDPSLPTIATVLHGKGYRTAAFTNICYLSGIYGFDRGFDHFAWEANGDGMAAITVREASRWLEDNIGNPRPFFMVIHFYDVHAPYSPPSPYDTVWTEDGVGPDSVDWWDVTEEGELLNPEERERLVGLYDGEIRWVDDQMGHLLTALRELDLAGSTVIMVTSDHGEEFLDHGWIGHGHTLYQEQLHVPLIISGPGILAGEVNHSVAGLWDIFPTITGLLGYGTPATVEGTDLLDGGPDPGRAVPAGAPGPDRYAFDGSGVRVFEPRDMASVQVGDDKVVWDVLADSTVQYDLRLDPDELDPLPPEPGMVEAVESYHATPPLCDPAPVESNETDQTLEDLGYI